MAQKKFFHIKTPSQVRYKISGSEFIGYCRSTPTESDFELFLHEVKTEHYNATHHCTAWIINPWKPVEFSQDDGEPSGTAGLPILNTMRSANLCNTGIIVVRYYGGTKLGKAGLIDAYSHTANLAIKKATLENLCTGKEVIVQFGYDQKKQVDFVLLKDKFNLVEAVYLEDITYTIQSETENGAELVTELEKLSYLGIKITDEKDILIYS